MDSKKKLKFTFIICNRDKESKLISFLKKKGYEKYFLFYAKGSASSEILEYLGLGETEKTVIVYPSSEKKALSLMQIIKESDYLKHVLAFRSPIKGISSKKSLDYFLKEVGENE